eukprot:6521900-Pyramimonas_sp.AAC.1
MTSRPSRSSTAAGPWFLPSLSGIPSMVCSSWNTHSWRAAHLAGEARWKSSTYAFCGTLKIRRRGWFTLAATRVYPHTAPKAPKGRALCA